MKEIKGKVVSTKMDKTITVKRDMLKQHRRYKKYLKKKSKFYAHDEKERAEEGDQVVIKETRPLSKKKRWKLEEIIGD